MSQKPIAFVTGNAKKLEEVVAILGGKFPRVIEQRSVNLVEEQGTIEKIAIRKCIAAAGALSPMGVIVEDTSLCFNALKGLPGPYIKCFLERVGPEGLYNMLAGFEDKGAEAVCTFAYCEGEGKEVFLFQGKTEGQIVSPRGSRDFGWDCCFQPNGFAETYGEMPKSVKNTISHRYKALDKLRDWFISKHSE